MTDDEYIPILPDDYDEDHETVEEPSLWCGWVLLPGARIGKVCNTHPDMSQLWSMFPDKLYEPQRHTVLLKPNDILNVDIYDGKKLLKLKVKQNEIWDFRGVRHKPGCLLTISISIIRKDQ